MEVTSTSVAVSRLESVLDADLYCSSDSSSSEDAFPPEETSKENEVPCEDFFSRQKHNDDFIDSITGENSCISSGTGSDTKLEQPEQEAPPAEWREDVNDTYNLFGDPSPLGTSEGQQCDDDPASCVENDTRLLAHDLSMSSDESEPEDSFQDSIPDPAGHINKSDELSTPSCVLPLSSFSNDVISDLETCDATALPLPVCPGTQDSPGLPSIRPLCRTARTRDSLATDTPDEKKQRTSLRTMSGTDKCSPIHSPATDETSAGDSGQDQSVLPSICSVPSRFNSCQDTGQHGVSAEDDDDAVLSTNSLSNSHSSATSSTTDVVGGGDGTASDKCKSSTDALVSSQGSGSLPDLPELESLPPGAVGSSSKPQGDVTAGSQETNSLLNMPDLDSLTRSQDNNSNTSLPDLPDLDSFEDRMIISAASSNLPELPDLDSVLPDTQKSSQQKTSDELLDMPKLVPVCSNTRVSKLQPSIDADLSSLSDNQRTSMPADVLSASSSLDQGAAGKSSICLQPSVSPTLDPMMASDSDESDSETLCGSSESDSQTLCSSSSDQLPDLGQKRKKKHRKPPNQASLRNSGADYCIISPGQADTSDDDDVIITRVQDKRRARPRLKPVMVDLTFDSDSNSSDVQSLDAFGGNHAPPSLLSSIYNDHSGSSDSGASGDRDNLRAGSRPASSSTKTVIAPSLPSVTSVIDTRTTATSTAPTSVIRPSSSRVSCATSRRNISEGELQCAVDSIAHSPAPPPSSLRNTARRTSLPTVLTRCTPSTSSATSADQDCLIIDPSTSSSITSSSSTTSTSPRTSSRKRSSTQKQLRTLSKDLTDGDVLPNFTIGPCPRKKQKKPPKKRHNAPVDSLPTISGPLDLRKKNREKRKAPVSSSASSSVISVSPSTPVLSVPPPDPVLSLPPPLPFISVSPPTPAPPFNSTSVTIPSPQQAHVQPSVSHAPTPVSRALDAPYVFIPVSTPISLNTFNTLPTVSTPSTSVDHPWCYGPSGQVPGIQNVVDFLQADVHNYQAIRCGRCQLSCLPAEIILCEAQHQCCKRCLESIVRKALISPHKEWIHCPVGGCNIQYSRDKLRMCLQPVLFDLLQEKMDQDTSSQPNTVSQDRYIPSHWEPMPENMTFQYIKLDKNDVEYQECALAFYATMKGPRAQICNIYRIQNPFQWRLYSLMKEKMLAEHGNATILEKKLFHGTNVAAVSKISESGFDWRLSGLHGSVYGEGSYFARDASYSHRYSPSSNFIPNVELKEMLFQQFHEPIVIGKQTRPATGAQRDELMQLCTGYMRSGIYIPTMPFQTDLYPTFTCHTKKHIMFRVGVLVGRYARGMGGMRRPPPLNTADPFGRAFDSCVDNERNPSIHVIFEHGKAYAEHVIEYTNETYGWRC